MLSTIVTTTTVALVAIAVLYVVTRICVHASYHGWHETALALDRKRRKYGEMASNELVRLLREGTSRDATSTFHDG